jgi:hypothetical protein
MLLESLLVYCKGGNYQPLEDILAGHLKCCGPTFVPITTYLTHMAWRSLDGKQPRNTTHRDALITYLGGVKP